MLDTVLKLIDRCIDLVKRREQVNRDLFNDFVEPAFADFKAVHRDYVESFRRYRTMISDEAIPLTRQHPIFQAIQSDNLYSQDLRNSVYALLPSANHPILGDFI